MDRVYLTNLYDIYSLLLNDKQKEYFEYYYFDNLSLGEISENVNVSRNAIYKQLKTVENKLLFYEKKLKLYEKSNKLEYIIENEKDKELKNKLEELRW
jgi:predicted DNA-binding protein YlxM (UPF0122 family)